MINGLCLQTQDMCRTKLESREIIPTKAKYIYKVKIMTTFSNSKRGVKNGPSVTHKLLLPITNFKINRLSVILSKVHSPHHTKLQFQRSLSFSLSLISFKK